MRFGVEFVFRISSFGEDLMLKKHFPVFLIALFVVLGCASTETVESTKVSPTEIYQDYAVSGNQSGTSVTATFRVAGPTGSTVDLDAPSTIEHNGKPMNESGPGFLKGTNYGVTATNFVTQHKFKYTDAAGKVWENEVSLEPLEITTTNLAVSKANGATLTLSRPVATDEVVEFSIASEKTPPVTPNNSNAENQPNRIEPDYSARLQVKFDDARNTVKIEPFSLKNFVDGKAAVKLTVRRNKPVQQSAKGGSIAIEYQSQTVGVIVQK